jgi:hypothetical protein
VFHRGRANPAGALSIASHVAAAKRYKYGLSTEPVKNFHGPHQLRAPIKKKIVRGERL